MATRLMESLVAFTQGGQRKIDRWTARYKVARVEWPVAPVDPFFNANTPEELVEAEKLLLNPGVSP